MVSFHECLVLWALGMLSSFHFDQTTIFLNYLKGRLSVHILLKFDELLPFVSFIQIRPFLETVGSLNFHGQVSL